MICNKSWNYNRYYECEILTDGPIKIGWQLAGASPDNELGNDENSWAYDGHYEEKVHSAVCDNYGKRWQVGDIIGVFLDIQDRTISKFLIFRKLICIFFKTLV